MEFNLFLWPMLVPMIIPLIYCYKYKKESLTDIGTIATSMLLIVILYWPLLSILPYVKNTINKNFNDYRCNA